MKYPKEYLDEIKARLKVSTLVSKTVNLKKRGKEFVGLSPFKNEKTPSFTVNDEKEFYHCFSTGEHGNIFDYLMKTQNLKFGEAVKTLASLAGMQPYLFSKKDEEREKKFNEYVTVISKYVDFSHQNLLKSNNQKLKNYLNKRNLNKHTIEQFKLGYVEFDTKLFEEFRKEFSEEVLKESGLFYFDENKKIFVDRFRNRLIFPIKNIVGKFIGLGGRIIEDKDYLAKYINSPETLFFKKGSNLFNLDNARKFSNKINSIYLVEGYMDVIGLVKNNVENVVANLGTALTDKQITILTQYFDHVIICFDSDTSGKNAALRAAENSVKELQPNKKISFLFLPEKEDPDSFINKIGKTEFLKFIKSKPDPITGELDTSWHNHIKDQIEIIPPSDNIVELDLAYQSFYCPTEPGQHAKIRDIRSNKLIEFSKLLNGVNTLTIDGVIPEDYTDIADKDGDVYRTHLGAGTYNLVIVNGSHTGGTIPNPGAISMLAF